MRVQENCTCYLLFKCSVVAKFGKIYLPSMQAAFVLLVILALGGTEELQRQKRLLFVNTRTVTSLHLLTVTSPTTIPVTCWTSAQGSPPVTQCTRTARGRLEWPSIRKIDERINREELLASIAKPFQVEPTVAPSAILADATESSSSNLVIKSPVVESSNVDAEITGLEHCAMARSPLGITMIYTVSRSLYVTQYATTVFGSVAIEVDGCTPSNFCLSKCP